jgi:hypothetical protein
MANKQRVRRRINDIKGNGSAVIRPREYVNSFDMTRPPGYMKTKKSCMKIVAVLRHAVHGTPINGQEPD